MTEEDKAPETPEIVTAFTVVMTLDGLVGVEVDVPGRRTLRQASHTDIQMMASFVRDSLVHPKPEKPAADKSIPERIAERAAARTQQED